MGSVERVRLKILDACRKSEAHLVQQGALRSVFLTKYYSGDQIKKTEVGRACSTYRVEERCMQRFSGET
jgi:hypothetical protein